MTKMIPVSGSANITIIVNPKSGRGRGERFVEDICRSMEARGASAEIVFTHSRCHARSLAAEAIDRGASIVVAAGGDGTLHEVANAIMASDTGRVTLGLLPLGTGNDFARGVGLYPDIDIAVAAITNGVRTFLDVGLIEGSGIDNHLWFVGAAGLGFVADAAAAVNNGIRFLSGSAAYLWGAVLALAQCRPFEIGVRIDGQDMNMSEATYVSISNVETTGGGIKIAPGADPGDGVFDVCVVGPITRLELLGQLPSVLRDGRLHHPAASYVRGQLIEVDTVKAKPLWVDGEIIGETPASFRLCHSRLPLMLPNPKNEGPACQ